MRISVAVAINILPLSVYSVAINPQANKTNANAMLKTSREMAIYTSGEAVLVGGKTAPIQGASWL